MTMIKSNATKYLEGSHKSRFRFAEKPNGKPRQPHKLSDNAKKYWDKIIADLNAMGHVGEIDSCGIGVLCEVFADYQESQKAYREEPNPLNKARLFKIYSSALNQLVKLQKAYGLTPEGRKTLEVAEPDTPEEREQNIKFFGN